MFLRATERALRASNLIDRLSHRIRLYLLLGGGFRFHLRGRHWYRLWLGLDLGLRFGFRLFDGHLRRLWRFRGFNRFRFRFWCRLGGNVRVAVTEILSVGESLRFFALALAQAFQPWVPSCRPAGLARWIRLERYRSASTSTSATIGAGAENDSSPQPSNTAWIIAEDVMLPLI